MHKCNMMNIIENLFAELDRTKISARQLSKRTGVAESTMWRWKRGKVSPNLSTLAHCTQTLQEMSNETDTNDSQSSEELPVDHAA